MDVSHRATSRKSSSKARAKEANLSDDAAGFTRLYIYVRKKADLILFLQGGGWEAGEKEFPTDKSGQLGNLSALPPPKLFH